MADKVRVDMHFARMQVQARRGAELTLSLDRFRLLSCVAETALRASATLPGGPVGCVHPCSKARHVRPIVAGLYRVGPDAASAANALTASLAKILRLR